MSEKPKRHQKVMRLRILKPAGEMTWSELGKMLCNVDWEKAVAAEKAIGLPFRKMLELDEKATVSQKPDASRKAK